MFRRRHMDGQNFVALRGRRPHWPGSITAGNTVSATPSRRSPRQSAPRCAVASTPPRVQAALSFPPRPSADPCDPAARPDAFVPPRRATPSPISGPVWSLRSFARLWARVWDGWWKWELGRSLGPMLRLQDRSPHNARAEDSRRQQGPRHSLHVKPASGAAPHLNVRDQLALGHTLEVGHLAKQPLDGVARKYIVDELGFGQRWWRRR